MKVSVVVICAFLARASSAAPFFGFFESGQATPAVNPAATPPVTSPVNPAATPPVNPAATPAATPPVASPLTPAATPPVTSPVNPAATPAATPPVNPAATPPVTSPLTPAATPAARPQAVKESVVQGLVDAATHALDNLLSRPYPEGEGSTTTEPPGNATPAPLPPPPPPPAGWRPSTGALLVGVANMANNVFGMVNTGAGLANRLVSQGTALATNITRDAITGTGNMAHMGLDGGAQITDQAMGVVNSVGQIIGPVKPIVDAVNAVAKPLFEGTFAFGHGAVTGVTGFGRRVIDRTNKTVQSVTANIGTVTAALDMAHKGVGKVTGGIVGQLSEG